MKTQNTEKREGENQNPLRNYCGRKNKERKKKPYLRNATPKKDQMQTIARKVGEERNHRVAIA